MFGRKKEGPDVYEQVADSFEAEFAELNEAHQETIAEIVLRLAPAIAGQKDAADKLPLGKIAKTFGRGLLRLAPRFLPPFGNVQEAGEALTAALTSRCTRIRGFCQRVAARVQAEQTAAAPASSGPTLTLVPEEPRG